VPPDRKHVVPGGRSLRRRRTTRPTMTPCPSQGTPARARSRSVSTLYPTKLTRTLSRVRPPTYLVRLLQGTQTRNLYKQQQKKRKRPHFSFLHFIIIIVEQEVSSGRKQRTPSARKFPRIQRGIRGPRRRQTAVRAQKKRLLSPPLFQIFCLTTQRTDGPTTARSQRQATASAAPTIITRPQRHTRTTRQRTRRVGAARTMPGSADVVRPPQARIRTTRRIIITPDRTRRLRRAILTLASTSMPTGPLPLTRCTIRRHVRAGRRPSWTASIASLALGGQCSSSGSSSPSP